MKDDMDDMDQQFDSLLALVNAADKLRRELTATTARAAQAEAALALAEMRLKMLQADMDKLLLNLPALAEAHV